MACREWGKATSDYGWTVLHSAADKGDLETVRWLVEQGADIKAANNYRLTVLSAAARNGDMETVNWLGRMST